MVVGLLVSRKQCDEVFLNHHIERFHIFTRLIYVWQKRVVWSTNNRRLRPPLVKLDYQCHGLILRRFPECYHVH